MEGPMGLPWSTLAALVVVAGSIVVAVVWAFITRDGGGRGDE
jgi:hypothetical protein